MKNLQILLGNTVVVKCSKFISNCARGKNHFNHNIKQTKSGGNQRYRTLNIPFATIKIFLNQCFNNIPSPCHYLLRNEYYLSVKIWKFTSILYSVWCTYTLQSLDWETFLLAYLCILLVTFGAWEGNEEWALGFGTKGRVTENLDQVWS